MKRLALILLLAGCADESLRGYVADPEASYRLVEMGGKPVAFDASIRFPEPGRVAGNGPCNSFGALQEVPYPWFELRELVSTERACGALASEEAFFNALQEMTESEASGDVLILRNGSDELVFRAVR